MFGTSAKVSVTTASALRHSAVWACQNLLADLVSSLPVHTFNIEGQQIDNPPIVESPTATLDAMDWRRQVMMGLLSTGNSVGLIVDRDRLQRPTQIELLAEGAVRAKRQGSMGAIEWKIDREQVPAQDVFHVPAYTMPGSPFGLSPIGHAREAIALGLAAEEFGAEWFGDGKHPTGLLKSKTDISDEGIATEARRRFVDAIRGREPAVLGANWSYEPLRVNPNESQFLETMKANVSTICRFFRVPPELVASDSGISLTYANVEQRSLDLLTYTVNSWVIRIERYISRILAPGDYIKLNVGALLRVDLKTRYTAHATAIRTGFLNRDEVRALEDLEPIPNGDGQDYLWPPFRAFAVKEDEE